MQKVEGGYVLTADASQGRVVALLPTDDAAEFAAEGLTTTGAVVIKQRGADGTVIETVNLAE